MKITQEDFNEAMRKGIAKGKMANENTVQQLAQELISMIDKKNKGDENNGKRKH